MVRSKNRGFTLIELLVVVIIVAVLAAVGLPLMQGNINRARASEAEAGLGTIRTGLRAYFAENRTYAGATLANIGISTNAGISPPGDLDGRFFDDNDYSLPAAGTTLTATAYCIGVTGGTGGTVIRSPPGTETGSLLRSCYPECPRPDWRNHRSGNLPDYPARRSKPITWGVPQKPLTFPRKPRSIRTTTLSFTQLLCLVPLRPLLRQPRPNSNPA